MIRFELRFICVRIDCLACMQCTTHLFPSHLLSTTLRPNFHRAPSDSHAAFLASGSIMTSYSSRRLNFPPEPKCQVSSALVSMSPLQLRNQGIASWTNLWGNTSSMSGACTKSTTQDMNYLGEGSHCRMSRTKQLLYNASWHNMTHADRSDRWPPTLQSRSLRQ